MSENINKTNASPKQESKSNLALILGILLLLSLGLSGYLFLKTKELKASIQDCGKEVDQTEIARQNVIAELNAMEAQYAELSEQNTSMSEELLVEREKIKQLIEQAKGKDWSIAKLNKEANTLREIMKGYLVTIDSLNTLNVNLTTENTTVKAELTDQKTKYTSLEQVKEGLAEKVKIGSLIQLVNVSITGQIKKGSGAQKYTDKASKVEVVKACYTIPQNSIASSGVKKIYMRIITPFGSVLAGKEDADFMVNGKKGVFTHMKEVEYNNALLDDCMYWDVSEPLVKGNYNIQLYSEGRELAEYTLVLK